MDMKAWSVRIPAAITDGERLLDGDKYVLIPPHMEGNDTNLTIVLTASEVEMAYALWEEIGEEEPEYAGYLESDAPGVTALRAFTETMERLDHD